MSDTWSLNVWRVEHGRPWSNQEMITFLLYDLIFNDLRDDLFKTLTGMREVRVQFKQIEFCLKLPLAPALELWDEVKLCQAEMLSVLSGLNWD